MSPSGLMGTVNPPSAKPTSADSAAPGICKELIGQSLTRLRDYNSGTDESAADRLASDLYLIYEAIQAISELYDGLDDDSQENGEQTKDFFFLVDFYNINPIDVGKKNPNKIIIS